jgi:hypothetical protein
MSANLPLTWSDKKNSPELEAFLKQYGDQYCMKAEEINQLRDAVNEMAVIQQSTFLGAAEPAFTPAGTGRAYWIAVKPGTYTNHGGVVIVSNELAFIIRDAAGAFSISKTGFVIPAAINKIIPWTAIAFASGDQVNYLGKDWFANAAIVAGDVPGTSSKWVDRLTGYLDKSTGITLSDSKNIYNSTFNISGKYINTSFVLVTAVNSIYAKIPVLPNQQYAYSHGLGGSYNSFNGFYIEDSSGTKVLSDKTQLLPLDKTGFGRVFTAPANSAFLYVNIYSDVSTGLPNLSTVLQIEKGDTVTSYSVYEHYSVKLNNYKIRDESAKLRLDILDSDKLIKSKTIALLGDSITAGSAGLTWVDILKSNKMFANIYNLARSGARWSHQSGTVYDITLNGVGSNVMWNQANKLIDGVNVSLIYVKPDVVIIKCGRNDANISTGIASDTFIGDIISRVPNTILNISDGIRYTCETLLNAFPDVQIILVTPIQWSEVTSVTYLTAGQIVKDCAGYLSVSVVDAGKESGIYKYYDTATVHKYLLDGTHPNLAGTIKLGNYIKNRLERLIIK